MAKIDCSIVKTLTDLELMPCYSKRLSNKFWAVSFYKFQQAKNKLKNKAFMLKFIVKAFVVS